MNMRHKNVNWDLPTSSTGSIETWDAVKVAVLMDLRDELQKLNALLYCGNFIGIPGVLREIQRNTTKRKRVNGSTRKGTR